MLKERKCSPNDKNLAKTHNLFEIGYKCACESGAAFSLRSLYVLFVPTGFHEISRHIRVIPCHFVAMIKIILPFHYSSSSVSCISLTCVGRFALFGERKHSLVCFLHSYIYTSCYYKVSSMVELWQSGEVLLIIILECRICIPQRRAESPIRI